MSKNIVTFPSGLRLGFRRLPYTRSVSVGVFVGVGSAYERPEEGGLSHFLEHMMFKGTGIH
jgi:predicted Zn-dependent peptidase